jgi:hypothetical protein
MYEINCIFSGIHYLDRDGKEGIEQFKYIYILAYKPVAMQRPRNKRGKQPPLYNRQRANEQAE